MQDLNIALVQTSLAWEDVAGNLAMLDRKLEAVGKDTDLVLLPEMFPTGFSMNTAACAEPLSGPAWEWLRGKAREKGCVIAGSILTGENGKYYNRFAWMRPDGTHTGYNKRHLFSMGGEHHTMTAGSMPVIVTKGVEGMPAGLL